MFFFLNNYKNELDNQPNKEHAEFQVVLDW